MCNQCNDPFHDLDDDLSDLLGGGPSQANIPLQSGSHVPTMRESDLANALVDGVSDFEHETKAAAAGHRYEEKCADCRGSGRFYSYSGRYVGPCFKCEGSGTRVFKTSPEDRAKARNARERMREQQAATLRANVAVWAEKYADAYAWMVAKSPTFDFASSMLEALNKFGSLTVKQFETVERLRLRDIERDAARAAEKAAREANAPAVDIAKLEEAFAAAISNGLKRPKVTLAGYKFSLAPASGRNAGALYVVRVEDDQYLGKIQGGKFTRVRECDDAAEAEIVEVAADPHNAAIAYGQRTGICACCGRELTNHESIELGIGPICRGKFGWA
jgi:hypothetical protein